MKKIAFLLTVSIFSIWAASCSSGKKAIFFYPMANQCNALTPHTLKSIPMGCARRGSVSPASAQKCILKEVADLCVKANVKRPDCIQKCVNKAPEDFNFKL